MAVSWTRWAMRSVSPSRRPLSPPLHGRHDGDFGSVGDGGVRAGVFLVDGDEVAVAPGGEGGVFLGEGGEELAGGGGGGEGPVYFGGAGGIAQQGEEEDADGGHGGAGGSDGDGGDGGGLEDADEGEIAVVAGVVESVADDEFVVDLEADVVGGDGGGALFAFAEEDAVADAGGVAFLGEAFADGVEGAAAVEDVIDDEDVLAGEVGEFDLIEGDDAGALGAAVVAGDGDGFHFQGEVDAAEEIGEEDEAAVEDGDDGEVFAGVVVGDGLAHGIEAVVDVGFVEEDFFDVGLHGMWMGEVWQGVLDGRDFIERMD